MGLATHSSILAWRIPWTEEPGGLQSTGTHRIWHDRSDLACTHTGVGMTSEHGFPQILGRQEIRHGSINTYQKRWRPVGAAPRLPPGKSRLILERHIGDPLMGKLHQPRGTAFLYSASENCGGVRYLDKIWTTHVFLPEVDLYRC